MANKDFEAMRKVRGVPYEIEGNKVYLYVNEEEPVELELEIGVGVYQTVSAHLRGSTGRRKKAKTLGNFTYDLSEDSNGNEVLVIRNKAGEVILEKNGLTDKEVRYIRNTAVNLILESLEG